MEPIHKIRKYKQTIENRIRCDVIEYPGQGHSFNSQEFLLKQVEKLTNFFPLWVILRIRK